MKSSGDAGEDNALEDDALEDVGRGNSGGGKRGAGKRGGEEREIRRSGRKRRKISNYAQLIDVGTATSEGD